MITDASFDSDAKFRGSNLRQIKSGSTKLPGAVLNCRRAGPPGEIQGSISYKTAGSSFELPQAGPQGGAQDARRNPARPTTLDMLQ
jgi:hypothetical protein